MEVTGTIMGYKVLHTYSPPEPIYHAVDRLAILHWIRIGIIATLFFGWRWSLWATVAAYLMVYIPNPWVSGQLPNGNLWSIPILGLVAAASYGDRRLIFPWRAMPAGGVNKQQIDGDG